MGDAGALPIEVTFPGLVGEVKLDISFSMRCTAFGLGRGTALLQPRLKDALKQQFGQGPHVWVDVVAQEVRIGPCLVQMDRTQVLVVRMVPSSGAYHDLSASFPSHAHIMRVAQAVVGQQAVVHWAGQVRNGSVVQRSSPGKDAVDPTIPDNL